MDVKGKFINFEKRKKIYDFILKNPGLHLRELNRRLNISFGSLRYHLEYLKKRHLIKKVKDNGFSRFYIKNNIGSKDKKLINVFRQEKLRKILLIFILMEDRHIFFKRDFSYLPNEKKWKNFGHYKITKHRTTLDFHLKKLIDFGLIEQVQRNRRNGYRLIESESLWDFLIRYDKLLSNKLVNKSLKFLNDRGVSQNIDKFLDNLWDIFPHPYYCN
jgi:predicted transcriptional regulator